MATYTVQALRNGICTVAGHHAYFEGDPAARYPFLLLVWLIEGPGGPMLVDTGLAEVEEMNQGAAHVLAEPITQTPDEDIRAQLAARGYTPADITRVFITHLHFDHVDQLDLYANAEIVVSKRGLQAALAQTPTWAPNKTLELLTQTAKERVLAADDCQILPGIDVLWLGGHSPWSQGIRIATAGGPLTLAGDAIFRIDQLENQIPIGIYHSLDEARLAITRLQGLEGLVLPSHDPTIFERFADGRVG